MKFPKRHRIYSSPRLVLRVILITTVLIVTSVRPVFAADAQILTQLNNIRSILGQIGPALSVILFTLAGIFYALGQMLPPDKKANFHTAAINIIIGAVVVGALSVASSSLAIASSHLLGNLTVANSIS